MPPRNQPTPPPQAAINPALERDVLKRDGGCVLCGHQDTDLQIHHRNPEPAGGHATWQPDTPSNLITLCPTDRTWIQDAPDQAIEMGLRLLPADDPRDVPVAHAQYGSVYLADDATLQHPPTWDR